MGGRYPIHSPLGMSTVPFKANADRRHHIPRQQDRVTNWSEYDAGLRQRGSLTVWFSEEAIAAWRAEPRTTRGGQPRYSALAITTAMTLTTNDVDDGSQVGPLLDQIDGPIASFTGDGAYDQDGVYSAVAARHPEAAVIVPPRSNAVPSETADTAPTPRDRHLQAIAEHGRMGWQKTAGYNWRALVEADIGRWKRVIGHALRSQTDKRQATEVALAVDVLNRILELGRPSYVRIL